MSEEKDKVPRTVAVPEAVYAQLLEAARWIDSTPGWLHLSERTIDAYDDFCEEQLRDHVPEGVDILNVETGRGCGLVAILEGYGEDGKSTGEVRARVRRA